MTMTYRYVVECICDGVTTQEASRSHEVTAISYANGYVGSLLPGDTVQVRDAATGNVVWKTTVRFPDYDANGRYVGTPANENGWTP